MPMLLPLWAPLLIEHHQLVGRLHRQLAQQDLIDQREDRGVGADPQRQRQDRDGREQRAAAKAAQGEPEVGEDGSHWLLGRCDRPGRW